MTREALDSLDKETLIRLVLAQAETIATLTKQCETLLARVAELEAKLGLPPKTPDNSSTPPSKGQKPSAPAATKGDGKRKAHPGAHRPLHPNPTTKRDIVAGSCQHCGADVSQRPQIACDAYDHIEIPDIKPSVTRVTLFGGSCPCCAKRFKAPAPQDMPKGSPFGANLRALVIYLRFTQGIAFERLATLLSDLLGLDISEGALVNIFEASRDAFVAARSAIRARLLSGTALQSDETGLRVGKTNWWLWVFHHGDSAVFVAKPSRAKAVVEEFLGDFRPDYWVSDRYGGQMGFATKDNQVCLAHLIRDVQYAIDAGDDVFAPDLRHLLGRACRIGRRRERLADATLKAYASRLDARLDQLMARAPTHEAGVKLHRMIKRTRRYMFVFVTNRDLPATNNGSERALRPCAVFRKITNGFRTGWGAALYADIRSVIETARRRAIGALEAIRLTLAGKPLLAEA
ncbi:MAG: IS66 family transposase [Methylocystis silviterrae]|uniref:IS66 family transposase n=1 Tax=Methylocystis silviterrae TaxID=2743612 RepID=UPI003C73E548